MFDSGNILDMANIDQQQQRKAPLTKGLFKDAGYFIKSTGKLN